MNFQSDPFGRNVLFGVNLLSLFFTWIQQRSNKVKSLSQGEKVGQRTESSLPTYIAVYALMLQHFY